MFIDEVDIRNIPLHVYKSPVYQYVEAVRDSFKRFFHNEAELASKLPIREYLGLWNLLLSEKAKDKKFWSNDNLSLRYYGMVVPNTLIPQDSGLTDREIDLFNESRAAVLDRDGIFTKHMSVLFKDILPMDMIVECEGDLLKLGVLYKASIKPLH